MSLQGFSSKLDQYEIEERIGQGSQNTVYAARHKVSGLHVAIKTIKTPTYKRLTREQHVSEGVAHYTLCRHSDHMLKFVEAFTEGSLTYIVTKLARNGDLLNHLGNRNDPCLSEDEARRMFVQLVRGVRDMHENGIVHRDLKHLNIFISGTTAKPKVRIGDFGLSVKLSPKENYYIKKQAGTLGYMAPEIIQN